MSGGHWEYIQYRFTDVSEDIENIINKNGKEKTKEEIKYESWRGPDWYEKYPEDKFHYEHPDEIIEAFKKAVDLVGKVLGDNPDISVLIEGHTDNDKITGTIGGGVENNWDLSTKRATAIVTILSANAKVKKENLTAAGRGEYAPLLSNETADGKAKNRRIEIILTPKLDEISKMLNEF